MTTENPPLNRPFETPLLGKQPRPTQHEADRTGNNKAVCTPSNRDDSTQDRCLQEEILPGHQPDPVGAQVARTHTWRRKENPGFQHTSLCFPSSFLCWDAGDATNPMPAKPGGHWNLVIWCSKGHKSHRRRSEISFLTPELIF